MTGLGCVVFTFACGWKFLLVRSFECDFHHFHLYYDIPITGSFCGSILNNGYLSWPEI